MFPNPMPTLFALWKAPFSGDVTQRIEPRLFSDDIAGQPDIEAHIHTEVASYGTQLSVVIDALRTLSQDQGTPLPEVEDLHLRIRAGKAVALSKLAERTAESLDRLAEADPDRYARLLATRMGGPRAAQDGESDIP
ncbi:hypothetical protein [Pseudooceanicola sp. HF7]|uniref:hypothetical protein n=1 Tax=Pseudooceanicola sp. HF7 TaxID=2721560 RepID=UPI0014300FD6|nr:hypothetical protein [Pseudooceanicola sp. HF7]NIZ09459.1 hypothetical protein [Pseudooceanicola sp. HF7]